MADALRDWLPCVVQACDPGYHFILGETTARVFCPLRTFSMTMFLDHILIYNFLELICNPPIPSISSTFMNISCSLGVSKKEGMNYRLRTLLRTEIIPSFSSWCWLFECSSSVLWLRR